MSDTALVSQFNANRLAQFDPRLTKERLATAEAVAVRAAKLQDWPQLELAVDFMIDEQRHFVKWWDQNVIPSSSKRVSGRKSVSVADIAADGGISKVTVSRLRKSLAKPEKYRDRVILSAYRAVHLTPVENHRAEGTGENEWFTPPEYIAAARAVMGDIDLDPATHAKAQETIQAGAYFTRERNGLAHDWLGRVWLNPPYAPPLIGQFVSKLIYECSRSHVTQAVLLTHNYTDTAWFHEAEAAASLLCFTRGRIRFVDIDGDPCSPTQGQCFFYFGPAIDAFRASFSRFGFVR